MQEERCWFLVSLKLSGEATPEELQELEAMLSASAHLRLQVARLTDLWNTTGTAYTPAADAYNRHLQRLSHHLSNHTLPREQAPAALATEEPPLVVPHSRATRWRKVLAIAAVLALVAGAGWYLLPRKETAGTPNTISTRRGSKSRIQLPDGTVVMLNGDSRIAYNADAFSENRLLQLSGEAFFDVAPDAQHPFVIQTSSISIRVLGTAFNVRAYANEKTVQTALIRGAVEVTLRNKAQNSVVLKPRQKLVVLNTPTDSSAANTVAAPASLLRVETLQYPANDSMALEALWTKNKLVFNAEPLEEVALKIERWYDVKVLIADARLKKTLYSGVFEDETLLQVMQALQLTGSFHYTIRRKEVVIQP
jgi:ferric-dicitrate binding protein FerR (iron transport regulator)